jgi:hypothetical protein
LFVRTTICESRAIQVFCCLANNLYNILLAKNVKVRERERERGRERERIYYRLHTERKIVPRLHTNHSASIGVIDTPLHQYA